MDDDRAANSAWGAVVAVTLYHEPEDEAFEGGYGAVTMSGVPENVQIKGTDLDTAGVALQHLTAGLTALGFGGRLLIHDVTVPGSNTRYEMPLQSI